MQIRVALDIRKCEDETPINVAPREKSFCLIDCNEQVGKMRWRVWVIYGNVLKGEDTSSLEVGPVKELIFYVYDRLVTI